MRTEKKKVRVNNRSTALAVREFDGSVNKDTTGVVYGVVALGGIAGNVLDFLRFIVRGEVRSG